MQVIVLTFRSAEEMIEQLPRLMKQLPNAVSAEVPDAGVCQTKGDVPVVANFAGSVPSNSQMSLAELARVTIAAFQEHESRMSKQTEPSI